MPKILDNLPERGYADNPNVTKLLAFPEAKVSEWADTMANFHTQLDAATSTQLEYLGYLFGFTGVYWSATWSDVTKRNIVSLGMKYWAIRGTSNALNLWLVATGIQCSIWQGSVLSLPFKIPAKLGTRRNKVVFRLPLSTIRGNSEWLEAVRMANHLVPVMTPSRVGYETFRLGFSKLGEPMFSNRIFSQDITDANGNLVSRDGTDEVTT